MASKKGTATQPNYTDKGNHPYSEKSADMSATFMQRHWGFGEVTLGAVSIGKGRIVAKMVGTFAPLGAKVDPPELHGSNKVDHDHGSSSDAIGLQVFTWPDGSASEKEGVTVSRDTLDDPKRLEADPRAQKLGPAAQLLSEVATRKETAGGGGGEVVEYSWRLSWPQSPNEPDAGLLAYLLRRPRRVISLHRTQYTLPESESKADRKPARLVKSPAASRQATLLEQSAAPEGQLTTTLDLSDSTMADAIEAEAKAELAGASVKDRARIAPAGSASKGKKKA